MGVKWRRKPDRLDRLAAAIEALGEQDQRQADENSRIEALRATGAIALHDLCREFVEALNQRLSAPALALAPAGFTEQNFQDPGRNLIQINLRGRLLMLEFEGTGEPVSTDDYRRPYILHGSVRSLNQDLLDRNLLSEKSIFFCPHGESGQWHFVDHRTYRSGVLTADLLAGELEKLL